MSEYQLGRMDGYAEILSMAQLLAGNAHLPSSLREAWQAVASALELRMQQEARAVPGRDDASLLDGDDEVANVAWVTDEEEEAVLANLEEIKRVVRIEGRIALASHRRRCCVHAGVREWTEIECQQHDWDDVKEWCRTCGVTRGDLLGGPCDE